MMLAAPVVQERRTLWPFALGTRQTLGVMARLIREDSAHPAVRQVARMATMECSPVNRACYAHGIRAFLADRFKYFPDPVGMEELTRPERTAREILATGSTSADCDDSAMLGGALARAAGLRVRLRAMAVKSPVSPFSHVRAEAFDGSLWRSLDVAWPNAPDRRSILLEV